MNIVFVSAVHPLQCNDATSTDIMTYNLLYGIQECGYKIHFYALSNNMESTYINQIEACYAPLVNKINIIKSNIGENKGKYNYLFRLFLKYYNYFDYKYIPDIDCEPNNTILISHSPSIDSIYVCRIIRKIYPTIKYVEYWSDPIALSGISLESYTYKRWLHKWLEKRILRYADKIIYGTKPLMVVQKKLFKEHSNKISYIDIGYNAPDNKGFDNLDNPIDNYRFLYAGNYYNKYRNINPLLNAAKQMNSQISLDVYGEGDIEPIDATNITFHKRVSAKEIKKIESSYKNIICIMNKSCIQIPGKTFYNIDKLQNILIILDGPICEEIKAYLRKYNRFILCDNNVSEIKQALRKMSNLHSYKKYDVIKYSPKAIAEQLFKQI